MIESNTNSSLINKKYIDCIAALYKDASNSNESIPTKPDPLNVRYNNNPDDGKVNYMK
jgi:hypothetical protein